MNPSILAQASCTNLDCFPEPVRSILTAVMTMAGILILLYGLFKAVKSVVTGQVGAGLRVILICGVLAALLIFPNIMFSLVRGLGDLASSVFDSLPAVGRSGGGGAPPVPGP